MSVWNGSEGSSLRSPFLRRAGWLRGRGRISHLLRIICEHFSEMCREHVSLFHPHQNSHNHWGGSQVLTRCFKRSQPPSTGQLRTRRKSDSGASAPGTPIDLRGIGSMYTFPSRYECTGPSVETYIKCGSHVRRPSSLQASHLPPTSQLQGRP